jgi:MFS family permease
LRRKENGLALFNRGDRSQSNDEAVEPVPDTVISTDTSDNDYFTPTRYTGTFASFHYSDFRLLWIGQLGWSGANWMEQVARNWLIWELTGSGVALGLVNLFRALPQLFMALPSGVVADRFNKKYVLMACQSVTMSSYVILTALVFTDLIRVWHIYAFSFLMGISMVFNQPARNALIPSLVPKINMMNAFALNQVAMNSMRVIAPGIAGLMIWLLSTKSAYAGAVILFTIVIVTTIMLDAPRAKSVSKTSSAGGQLKEGLSYVVGNKNILVVMIVALAVFTFVMPYNTLMPIMADEVLKVGAFGFGLLLSVAGIGALVGGLAVASFNDIRHKGMLFLLSSFGYGFAVFLLGLSPHLGLGIALPIIVMLFIGAAQAIFMTAGNVALLAQAPEDLRGRVLSVYNLDRGLMPLGSMGGGGLADAFSATTALMMMGGVAALMVATVGVFSSRIRRL